MALMEQVVSDLKEAMKSGDSARKDVLRMLKSQLKNKEIELGRELSPEDEIQVLQSAVKSRRESLELYKQGNRQDLVEKEEAELNILLTYLPKQMSEEEVVAAVESVIADLNVTSMKDMGRVMKEMMSRYRGQVDGKKVQEIVKAKLAAL